MWVTSLDGVAQALGLFGRRLVALVGGGGKTTLLFALGRTLPPRTLLTTTTRMGRERTGGFACLIGPGETDLVDAFDADDAVLAWRSIDERKAVGFSPDSIDRWFASGLADRIIVEADGARRRPFTAPAPWEPPIPSSSTNVLACIGAEALGYVIADRLHRPLRVAAAAECSPYQRLTPRRAAAALTSELGMRKNVPATARFSVIVSGADPHDPQVQELVAELDQRGTESLVVLKTDSPKTDSRALAPAGDHAPASAPDLAPASAPDLASASAGDLASASAGDLASAGAHGIRP
ncbi:MAG: selenium cofactor biosynthesis protein YqeC [Acidimicrobiaceae bacterium]|nr:selenium cofactor biosynthesis protein YqeC [Acidimicrobiaceae bacterium]MCY4280339.1 selenium cofactor biosynthesis protein YqeC [Acidimicrobiaceae bacterium]MCY4294815.1 selenium cofactor biosynthesis protein YqeC [Acidimicrobiaceae bacterium]